MFVVINILVLMFVRPVALSLVTCPLPNWTGVKVNGMVGQTGVLAGVASCFWVLAGFFELILYAVEGSS